MGTLPNYGHIKPHLFKSDHTPQVGVNQGRLQETVNDYEDYISHLKEDLATTQLKYQDMMEENNGLKEKLDSLSSLQDQQKLLAMEVGLMGGGG